MKRKILLLPVLLSMLLLFVSVSLADHSSAYDSAAGLFIAGEYEQAYSAFMKLDSKEPFEEWVDRFLFEYDSKLYMRSLSKKDWENAAVLILDMERRCYAQEKVGLNDLLNELLEIGEHFYPGYDCDAFLRDVDAFLMKAKSVPAFSSLNSNALAKIDSIGAECLKIGDYTSAKKCFLFTGNAENAVGVMEEEQNAAAYAEAEIFVTQGKKARAAIAFENLGGYKDAASRAKQLYNEIGYAEAEALLAAGKKAEAAGAFEKLGGFDDAASRAEQLRNEIAYAEAESLLAGGKRLEAAQAFAALGSFSDAAQRAEELYCELVYEVATDTLNNRGYEEAAGYFDLLGDYRDAAMQAESARNTERTVEDYRYSGDYNRAVALFDSGDYEAALPMFASFNGFRDSLNYINRIDYKRAELLYEQGSLKEARAAFAALGDFQDSEAYVERIGKRLENPFLRAKVGDLITFGSYEQDNDLTNGKEPIEWRVLEVQEDKVLAISEYGLDTKPYNETSEDATWETCTLRKWLNEEFLNVAFSADDLEKILVTRVDNSISQGYSGWNTPDGNDTEDRLFLLSCAEANRYFGVEHYSVAFSGTNTKARVEPTPYAKTNGAMVSQSNKTEHRGYAGYWWLRSHGEAWRMAARVFSDGYLSSNYHNYRGFVIRPAMWIELSK